MCEVCVKAHRKHRKQVTEKTRSEISWEASLCVAATSGEDVRAPCHPRNGPQGQRMPRKDKHTFLVTLWLQVGFRESESECDVREETEVPVKTSLRFPRTFLLSLPCRQSLYSFETRSSPKSNFKIFIISVWLNSTKQTNEQKTKQKTEGWGHSERKHCNWNSFKGSKYSQMTLVCVLIIYS